MDENADLTPPPTVNRTQLATVFGVSENTINKWIERGMPVEGAGGNGRAYEFAVGDCRAWHNEENAKAAAHKQRQDDHVNQQRMDFLGVKKNDRQAGLSASEMKDLAQAELVYMQAAAKRGALVPVEEMVELLDSIFTEVRNALDGQPDFLEREFSLNGEQVQRIVKYNDGVLAQMKIDIENAALEGSGLNENTDLSQLL